MPPYSETGGSTEKPASIPAAVTPAGSARAVSSANARSRTRSGSAANASTEYTRLLLKSTRPAPCRLQYSSVLSVPARLCSINWRLEDLPSTPASTLGLAAASITQSAGGRVSKSAALRTSPCHTRMPAQRSRSRFCSEPGRMKLSMPKISTPPARSARLSASVLPANPQIPVIKIFMPWPRPPGCMPAPSVPRPLRADQNQASR